MFSIIPVIILLLFCPGEKSILSNEIQTFTGYQHIHNEILSDDHLEIAKHDLCDNYDMTWNFQKEHSYTQENSRFTIHSVSFFSEGYDVSIKDDHAYCVYNDGLVVFDVSDPSAPVLLNEVFIKSRPEEIVIKDDIAIILEPYKGFEFYDIAIPNAPTFAGEFTEIEYPITMELVDSIGYLLVPYGLRILDFSYTLSPTIIGELGLPRDLNSITIQDTLAYIAAEGDGLYIVDISDSQNLQIIMHYYPFDHERIVECIPQDSLVIVGIEQTQKIQILQQLESDSLLLLSTLDPQINIIDDMVLVDEYLYVGGRNPGVKYACQVIDIGDPLNPDIVFSFQDPNLFIESFTLNEHLLYIADLNNELRIWDVSDPASPQFIWISDQPSGLRKIEINSEVAYIVDSSRFFVLSIEDLGRPFIQSEILLEGYPSDLKVKESYAYVVADDEGLYVIDVSDPTSPYIVNQHTDSLSGSRGIVLRDSLAFICDILDGMKILNISDPQDIEFISMFDSEICLLENLVLAGNYAYLANWESIIAVDISDITNPAEIARWSEDGGRRKRAIEYFNNTIYYNDIHTNSFYIRDVTNPDSSFVHFQGHMFSGYVYDYHMNFPILFVPDGTLSAVCVENPVEPQIVEEIYTPHRSNFIAGRDSLLFSSGSSLLIASFDMSGVGIEEEQPHDHDSIYPMISSLHQNYPNPFNPTTSISFDLPGTEGVKQHINLTVYSLRGRHVKTLMNEDLDPGTHQVVWDGKNEQGEQVSSGIFLYTLKIEDQIYTRKMVVIQ